MKQEKKLVGLVPLGDVPEIALKVIAANISGYFNLDSRILPPLASPEYAFDQNRLQYNAAVILKAFESIPSTGLYKIIGVVNLDIFVPIFTHVYGEARQGGKFALVSIYRLAENPQDRSAAASLLYDRSAKVALHELGHLLDLHHCERQHCLMHFSGELDDIDRLPFALCRYCQADFKSYLGRTS